MNHGPSAAQHDSDAILSNLSVEISRPLGLLQTSIARLLGGHEGVLSDAERSQAETLSMLCQEIDRLTHDYLDSPDSAPA